MILANEIYKGPTHEPLQKTIYNTGGMNIENTRAVKGARKKKFNFNRTLIQTSFFFIIKSFGG
jgi:hypothetical protein